MALSGSSLNEVGRMGDSVIWGQGLLGCHKFTTLVAKALGAGPVRHSFVAGIPTVLESEAHAMSPCKTRQGAGGKFAGLSHNLPRRVGMGLQ
jgi:hypothetical protein